MSCWRSGQCLCCACVHQTEIGVVENCGRYDKLIGSGCSCLLWPCESVAGRVSLRVYQLQVQMDTVTKDNVFVKIEVAVMYTVVPTSAVDAYYKLTNHREQIKSHVYDVIRSTLPKMELDRAFESQDSIAVACKQQLQALMTSYGYEILEALITNLEPDIKVKNSMNDINASQRLREAAREKAEAEKILVVKAAEGAAEAKYLSGVGVARQRRAIMDSLKDSINDFSSGVEGTTAEDVMDLLVLTQYFDMLRDVGANRLAEHSPVLFLPHGPQAVHEYRAQIRDGFMQDARKFAKR